MRFNRGVLALLAALFFALMAFAADGGRHVGSFKGERYGSFGGPMSYRFRPASDGGSGDPVPWALGQDFPRYASYGFRDFYGETITPALYDSMATLDFMIVQSSALLGTRGGDGWAAMTDSVRARNPKWSGLVYLNVYGIQNDGEVSAYPYISNRYDMIDRNDFWMYDTAGDRVDHCPGFCSFDLINPGAPGVADSLAVFWAEQIERSDFMAHHNGVFLDWLMPDYPQWACGSGDDCQDVIDFDRDGSPYSSDADDQVAWDTYCDRFVTVLREELDARTGHANGLIVVNGANVVSASWASKVDGTMFENLESYGPDTQTEWLAAANITPGVFSSERLEYPLVVYDVKGNPTGGTLAAGLIGVGSGSVEPDRQFNAADRVPSIGVPAGDAYFSATGDTIRRDFTGGSVALSFDTGWHSNDWEWLVTSVEGDTLSRSDGWPRRAPDAPLALPAVVYYTATQVQTANEEEIAIGSTTSLDSLATMDVVQFHMALYDEDTQPQYTDIVAGLRARNPEIIVLDYLYVWGAEDQWVNDPAWGPGNIRYDYWQFIDSHDYWLRDTAGNRVADDTGGGEPYLVNIGFSEARADSFAAFFADYINASDNSLPYTGAYLDYFMWSDFPDYPCTGGCRDLVDYDEDGIVYSSDVADERAAYQNGIVWFLTKLREKVSEEKFLIITNGTGHHESGNQICALTDGGYYEIIDDGYYPNSTSHWNDLLNVWPAQFSTDVLSRPLTLFDAIGVDGDEEKQLVAASLAARGSAAISKRYNWVRRFWTLEDSPVGRIDLGLPVAGGLAYTEGDTAYTQYEKGYVRFFPDVVGPTYLDHQFVVVDTVTFGEPDTLLISDGWPRHSHEEPLLFTSASLDSVGWADGPSAPADSGFVGTRSNTTENQYRGTAWQVYSQYTCNKSGPVAFAYARHKSVNQDMAVNSIGVWDNRGELLAFSTGCTFSAVNPELALYTLNTTLILEEGVQYRLGQRNTDNDGNVYYTQTSTFIGVGVQYETIVDSGVCENPTATGITSTGHASKGLAMWLSMDPNEDGSE